MRQPASFLALLATLVALVAPDPARAGGDLPTASDNSGAFTYQVPIEVPPGPADSAPALLLTYSSAAGNGDAGVGWSLPYSAIRLDTSWGTPAFWLKGVDICDPLHFEGRLYLDGSELVPHEVPDAPSGSACELRTRPDTYTRVYPVFGHGECGGGSDLPSGFAVVRADGTTWWYGSDDTCDVVHVERASADAGEYPTRWLLQHVQDRDGNLVSFHPERLDALSEDPADWWTDERLPASDPGGCDGCLRAVTWAERRHDSVSAYGASPGSAPPYGPDAAPQVGRFADLQADPGAFWPQADDHFYAVQIDWEPRPDVRTSFLSGAPRRLDRRIRQIAVLGDASVSRPLDRVEITAATPIRTYRLDYEASTTGRSRLTRVWPFLGMYRADGDYGDELGLALPVDGTGDWTPASFVYEADLPNPWEFAWTENSVLEGAAAGIAVLPEASELMSFPSDALPWMGAHWREGGYPTISMMDLNGDGLPEIVQHDDDLPRYITPLEGLVDVLGNPFVDQIPYAGTSEYAEPDEAANQFFVRWNQGNGFTDLEPGPVDPFALQEVGYFQPRIDCTGDGVRDDWDVCRGEAAQLSGQGELASYPPLDELLEGEDLCSVWWSGAQSLAWATDPGSQNALASNLYSPDIAAWCEYRSCAPYCEPGSSVLFGVHALADSNEGWQLDDVLQYVPMQRATPAPGHTGDDLVLWRRYGVTQATSGSVMSTAQAPFPFDPILLGIEPASRNRWVDGYARPSFSVRVRDSVLALGASPEEVVEMGENGELLSPDELLGHTVVDGLVQDTRDINGDGFPDRILGGAAVLENNTGLSPSKYSAPPTALVNEDSGALKGEAISTAHMPWFVSLFDPDTGEFGALRLWDLPLADEFLMGGPAVFADSPTDPRLFYEEHDFGFLEVWEMTNSAAPSPVSGGASVSPSRHGPSVGGGVSIGPVSFGAGVSSAGLGGSVGVGPISFSAGGMSIGPVSLDFAGGVQGGAGVFRAVWFGVTKALQVFSIPYDLGISMSSEGFGFSAPGIGGDCATCATQARWKRQGLVDINGDGLEDYVIAHNERWEDPSHPLFGEEGWAVVLNEGDGFAEEAIRWPGVRSEFLEFTRTEPYRNNEQVNTALGFRRSQTMASLRDINGDGLPDFVYAGSREGERGCRLPEEVAADRRYRAWDFVLVPGAISEDRHTLCVQLNSGTGFLEPVDWFDGAVPAEVFSEEPGFVPSVAGTRTYVERSPTYNDGYAVGLISLQDWNGDGLLDFTQMVDHGTDMEGRRPRVYLNDGRRFVSSPAGDASSYGRVVIETGNHVNSQEPPPGLEERFLRPYPNIDVSKTHMKPGGSIIQSAFLDLNGDGTLDWAQSIDADEGPGPHIRLIPLQDAVPDMLAQVWEPRGAVRRVTYGPARDHMDLPLSPRLDLLPDGSPVTDGVPDSYPASSQVVTSQVVYDGLGPKGNLPVGLTLDYADPGYAHADPSLTAGTGLKHPAFRHRSMGWGQISTSPCPGEDIDADGACVAAPDIEVVQDFSTDWMATGVTERTRLFDGAGRLRSEQVVAWDMSPFATLHAGDPDVRSAFGVMNWHFAATHTESRSIDPNGVALRSGAAYDYEVANGLALCAVEDLDGDGWGDRLSWTGYDAGLIADGRLDVLETEARSELPLGAMRADQPATCFPGMAELSAPYAIQETWHLSYATGRRQRSETRDLVRGSPPLVVEFEYLPGGQLFGTTNAAGATAWTLWDPAIGAHPVEEHAPPTLGGVLPHITSTEVCGVTTSCPGAAWGQPRSQTTPDGNVVTTLYSSAGTPLLQQDLVESEPMAVFSALPSRRVGDLAAPPTGNVPARLTTSTSVDGNATVQSTQWFDGFGEPVLTGTDWIDELGTAGLRLEAAPQTDHRGLPQSQAWPCFSGVTALGLAELAAFDPTAQDLGLCDEAPPRESFDHDELGQLILRQRPDGAQEMVTHSHQGGGVRRDTTLVDPALGAVLETTVVEEPFRVTTTRHDAVTFRHDLPAGLPAPLIPDASDLVTVEERDAFGRRTEVWRTGNGSEVTRFAWDGWDRLTRYEDPDQGIWELDYDAEGRLAERRVLDRAGAVEAAQRYRYDAHGRIEQEEGFDTGLAYGSGQADTRVLWTYDVDPGTKEPAWTPLGAAGGEIGRASTAVQQRWDACQPGKWSDEQTFTWRYDQRGRVTEAAYAQQDCEWMGGGPTWMVTQSAYGPGDVEVARRVPHSGELLTTTYDAAGRPATLDSSHGEVVTAASWEIQGRPASLEYGNGVVQQYLYAPGQQSNQALTQSSVWSGTGEVLFQRDYAWDAAGNLRSWSDAAVADADAESWTCDYDGVGALLGCVNDSDPNEWMEYAYDVLGSLIHEDVRVDGEDRVASQFSRGTGGLVPVAGMTAPLNAPVARVVGPTAEGEPRDATSLFYDARGHLVGQRYHGGEDAQSATPSEQGLLDGQGSLLGATAERSFRWTSAGRLEAVFVGQSSPVRVSRNWYAPDGNRTAEQLTPESGASWTQARRFAGTRLVEELGGVVKQATTWRFGDVAVGQSHVDDVGGPEGEQLTLRWTGGDHLGSASIVTDEDGALVRGVRYEPYGRIRDEWGPETDPEDYAAGGLDDLFNGKPRTRDAFGLSGSAQALEGYDYGARIYIPELSRFISADTITPDTVWEANAFAYVRNNPLKYVDPDGHETAGTGAAQNGWFDAAQQFYAGMGAQWASDNLWGAIEHHVDNYRQTRAFVNGRKLGAVIAMVQGAAETAVGIVVVVGSIGGEATGGVLVLSGIGAPLGLPLVAVSAGGLAAGTGATVHGTGTMASGKDSFVSLSQGVADGAASGWKAPRVKAFDKAGIETTEHFRNRVFGRASRGITGSKALDAYNNGRLYYNPETKNYIRHSSRTQISVVVDKPSGGRAITVFEGKASPKWVAVPKGAGG